jgi:3-oxoadipate enol-lactonase
VIDLGNGPPVVLIPGIQGRWEWMRPVVPALAKRMRVITFSLAGEPGSNVRFDESRGFDGFIAQIDAALERTGVSAATICGVSFGGLIALRYAAVRPERTRALVLVSTPAPDWSPSSPLRRSMKHPRVLFPLFVLGAGRRVWQELSRTFPDWKQRVSAAARYAVIVLGAPGGPTRMSRRGLMALETNFLDDCARVKAPTLIVTGEPGMDHVVPPATTLQYARLIQGGQVALLEATGHLGIITRPERFAELIANFTLAHPDVQREPTGSSATAPTIGTGGQLRVAVTHEYQERASS